MCTLIVLVHSIFNIISVCSDEAETERKTEKYCVILETFIANPDVDCMEFPTTLTSFERMLVHEVRGWVILYKHGHQYIDTCGVRYS